MLWTVSGERMPASSLRQPRRGKAMRGARRNRISHKQKEPLRAQNCRTHGRSWVFSHHSSSGRLSDRTLAVGETVMLLASPLHPY